MKLTKLVCAAAVVAGCIGSAFAAGPYDGVYQAVGSSPYLSVHQSGSTLIVAFLGSVPANGLSVTEGGYTLQPPTIQHWSYVIGSMGSSNTARVSGVTDYGACVETDDVAFDAQAYVSIKFVSVADTALGAQQNFNCAAVYQSVFGALGTTTLSWRRLF